MTVAELIAELSKHDPSKEVRIGYDSGCCMTEVVQVSHITEQWGWARPGPAAVPLPADWVLVADYDVDATE